MKKALLLSVFIGALACSARAQVCFPNQKLYKSAVKSNIYQSWRAIATPDVNGDGRPDIVYYGTDSNLLVTFLGKGDGTFNTNPVETKTGITGYSYYSMPYLMASNDFNGDGYEDIALAGQSNLYVFFSKGDGTFDPASKYKIGWTPKGIISADFNKDGRPDIAVPSYGEQMFSVYYTRADKKQDSIIDYSLTYRPQCITSADVNHDGYADIITYGATSTAGYLEVYTWDKKGGFKASGSVQTTTGTSYLTAADIDGDKNTDIIGPGYYHLGDSAGKFGSMKYLPGNYGFCGNIFAVDLDKDKDIDLIYEGYTYLNSGGTFSNPHSTGGCPAAICDFNSDGYWDLVNRTDDGISVLLGTENGRFNTMVPFPFEIGKGYNSTGGYVLGDYDKDGRPDIMAGSTYTSPTKIITHFLLADGTYESGSYYIYVGGTNYDRPFSPLISADFRGNGTQDLVSNDGDKVYYHENKGNGAFTLKSSFTSTNKISGTLVGSFNKDSRKDFALLSSSSMLIELYRSNNTASLYSRSTLSVPYEPVKIIQAEMNGDSISDLITASAKDGKLTVFLSDNSGGYSIGNYTSGKGTADVRSADFNGDGKPDLAAVNSGDSTLIVFKNDGSGLFSSTYTYKYKYPPTRLVILDLNLDGKQDIIASLSNNDYIFHDGDGTGKFNGAAAGYLGINAMVLDTADLNGDGYTDMYAGGSGIAVLSNSGSGYLESPMIYPISWPAIQEMSVADVVPDGKPDLVIKWQNGGLAFLPNLSADFSRIPDTLCAYSPLDAGEGFRYKWSTGDTTRVIYPTSSGKYTVTIRNASGCESTASKQIYINPVPDKPIVTVYNGTTICGNDSIQLSTGKVTGLTYTWMRDGAAFKTGDTMIWVKTQGSYKLKVSSASGCVAYSKIVDIDFQYPIQAIIQQDYYYRKCEGDSIKLTAGYSGNKPDQYTWIYNGKILPENGPVLYAKKTGYYKVLIRRGGCEDLSDSVGTTFLPYPKAEINLPKGSYTSCPGLILKSLHNTKGYYYAWYKNGAPGVYDSILKVYSSGAYYLAVFNGNCYSISDTVQITILPQPPAWISPYSDQVICSNSVYIQLRAPEDTAATYTWYRNGTAVLTGTLKQGANFYDAKAEGTYRVMLSYKNGCSNTSLARMITVKTPPPATMQIVGDTVFCQGGNVTLKAQAPNGYYLYWYRNGQQVNSGPELQVYESGRYKFYMTDYICESTSREVTVDVNPTPEALLTYEGQNGLRVTYNSSYTYEWYRNDTLIPGVTGSTYSPAYAGYYRVKVTSKEGCSSFSNEFYVDLASGTGNAIELRPAMEIFPNPSSGRFAVRYTSPSSGKVSIRIVDALGRQLILERTKTRNEEVFLLDTDLKPGLYTVNLYDGTGHLSRQIVIAEE
jgi:hypothetical protein